MHKRTQSAHGGKNNSILHHYNNNRKIIKITKREMERDKSLAKSEILEVPAQNIIGKGDPIPAERRQQRMIYTD